MSACAFEKRVEGVVSSCGRVEFVARKTIGDEARILACAEHDDGLSLGRVPQGRVKGAGVAQSLDVESDYFGAWIMREVP